MPQLNSRYYIKQQDSTIVAYKKPTLNRNTQIG